MRWAKKLPKLNIDHIDSHLKCGKIINETFNSFYMPETGGNK